MCLAIPARLVEKINENEGIVEWSDVRMKVSIVLVPDVRENDWVMVHTGYAIQVVDPEAASESIALFKEMGYGVE